MRLKYITFCLSLYVVNRIILLWILCQIIWFEYSVRFIWMKNNPIISGWRDFYVRIAYQLKPDALVTLTSTHKKKTTQYIPIWKSWTFIIQLFFSITVIGNRIAFYFSYNALSDINFKMVWNLDFSMLLLFFLALFCAIWYNIEYLVYVCACGLYWLYQIVSCLLILCIVTSTIGSDINIQYSLHFIVGVLFCSCWVDHVFLFIFTSIHDIPKSIYHRIASYISIRQRNHIDCVNNGTTPDIQREKKYRGSIQAHTDI